MARKKLQAGAYQWSQAEVTRLARAIKSEIGRASWITRASLHLGEVGPRERIYLVTYPLHEAPLQKMREADYQARRNGGNVWLAIYQGETNFYNMGARIYATRAPRSLAVSVLRKLSEVVGAYKFDPEGCRNSWQYKQLLDRIATQDHAEKSIRARGYKPVIIGPSYHWGYMRRTEYTHSAPYNGRNGCGVVLDHPCFDSTRFHFRTYVVEGNKLRPEDMTRWDILHKMIDRALKEHASLHLPIGPGYSLQTYTWAQIKAEEKLAVWLKKQNGEAVPQITSSTAPIVDAIHGEIWLVRAAVEGGRPQTMERVGATSIGPLGIATAVDRVLPVDYEVIENYKPKDSERPTVGVIRGFFD